MTRKFVSQFVAGAVVVLLSQQAAFGQTAPKPALPEAAIEDNSFLIEEAFNQGPGIVQHINTLSRSLDGSRSMVYMLTQEWPMPNLSHQLSYSVPASSLDRGASRGVGDAMLNYRYNVPHLGERLFVTPRASISLPTGNTARNLGLGTAAVQFNLPVSLRISKEVIAHGNLGTTYALQQTGLLSNSGLINRNVASFNVGGSVIAPVTLPVQGVLEYVTNLAGSINEQGEVVREAEHILNPGLRFAINTRAMQIVPGLSVMLDLKRPSEPRGLFFYLSLEHAFRAVGRN